MLPGGTTLDVGPLIAGELQWLGSHGMAARDYPPMLNLVRSGALRPGNLVTRVIGLDEVPGALAAMPSAATPGVTVIRPGRLPAAGRRAGLAECPQRGVASRFVAVLADYLELTAADARAQFRRLVARRPVAPGKRQEDFLPVETLLCLAASFVVSHRQYDGLKAPEPVQSLAFLCKRPPSSILAKMANLDGSRPHGARWDLLAGATLREDPAALARTYRLILAAARAEGLGAGALADFLGLEHGGEFVLLGQEELDISDLETELARHLAGRPATAPLSERETERVLLAATRVGQHVFASRVLRNCGERCVFCGMGPFAFGARRMLVASHIKPWRDSSPRERLDHRNGLAA